MIISIIIFVLLISGCASVRVYDGNDKLQYTIKTVGVIKAEYEPSTKKVNVDSKPNEFKLFDLNFSKLEN